MCCTAVIHSQNGESMGLPLLPCPLGPGGTQQHSWTPQQPQEPPTVLPSGCCPWAELLPTQLPSVHLHPFPHPGAPQPTLPGVHGEMPALLFSSAPGSPETLTQISPVLHGAVLLGPHPGTPNPGFSFPSQTCKPTPHPKPVSGVSNTHLPCPLCSPPPPQPLCWQQSVAAEMQRSRHCEQPCSPCQSHRSRNSCTHCASPREGCWHQDLAVASPSGKGSSSPNAL